MTQFNDRPIGSPKLNNRIAAVMSHTDRYAFKGLSRLARDAGISKSALSRLLRGLSSPSYWLVMRVVHALEDQLGLSLDARDLITEEEFYPTAFVCRLCRCRGCLPGEAFDSEGNRTERYRHVQSGCWSGTYGADSEWEEIEEVE